MCSPYILHIHLLISNVGKYCHSAWSVGSILLTSLCLYLHNGLLNVPLRLLLVKGISGSMWSIDLFVDSWACSVNAAIGLWVGHLLGHRSCVHSHQSKSVVRIPFSPLYVQCMVSGASNSKDCCRDTMEE